MESLNHMDTKFLKGLTSVYNVSPPVSFMAFIKTLWRVMCDQVPDQNFLVQWSKHLHQTSDGIS